MCSRKSEDPRMEPWGTLAFTGYSCENLTSRRTTQRCLLLRKEEIRLNIWPEILWELRLWRRPPCQTLSKALDMSSTTAQVARDLLKAPAILSNTTIRRSAVDWEDLEPYWKSQKIPHFSRWSTILLFTSCLKTLLTSERRLTGQLF